MFNSFKLSVFLILFGLLSFSSAQTNVQICNAFDYSYPLSVTVTGSITQTLTINQATCGIFQGIGTPGNNIAISATSTNIQGFSTSGINLLSNSCLNTFVFVGQQNNGSLLLENPNQGLGETSITTGHFWAVIANYASDSLSNLQAQASLSSVNVTINNGGTIYNFGPVDDFHFNGNPQVRGMEIIAPLVLSSATVTAVGIYHNTSVTKVVDIPNVPSSVSQTIQAQYCYYAFISGDVGAQFNGAGYRIVGTGGSTSFGVVFSNVGNNSTATSSSGPAIGRSSSGGSSGGTPPTGSSSGGSGAAFSTAAVSPLLFILIAIISLISTRF
jgi:hypothetical protein